MKASLFAALACSASLAATIAAAEGSLNLYNYSGYISEDMVKKFEEKYDVKVTSDSYDSEETLLAKLKLGGAGYDFAVGSQAILPIIIAEGLAENIGASAMPGYANVIPDLQKPEWDPTGEYSIPYQWGTTNFAIDTAIVPATDSLKTLYEPDAALAGKINMLDSSSEVIAQASIYLGVPQCSEDPDEMQKVADLLTAQKPAVRSYSSKAGAIRDQLVAGEIAMSPLFSGSTMRGRELKPSIAYVYPKEGSLAWVDSAFVPKGAQNLENAKLFIAFLLEAENAAMNTNFLKYPSGIAGAEAFYDAAIKDAPEMATPASSPLVFKQACGEAAVKLQDLVWTNLMK